ncbi:hypothetical protein GPECTOR_15g304 [Gonium pectorale]|uniref:Protein kinase domain-containing protein n=1 Tax=Gonium pectorale TaxID=33097 RepID=A0A150GLE7_GONPE|nr:hypothetical protein GPECTOR_15g304 [Gonium pectorale]|eukprot:KXZ50621.1 hypothetical protein GPECTOR_15g304 [Gonium pectorale]
MGSGAVNAKRVDVQPEEVNFCEPGHLMDGLRLTLSELGRGSFGIVIEGAYRTMPCAVKILTSPDLDRTALRELMLGPSLVHPHVVATYSSRCARLTHEFFDLLEGNDKKASHDPAVPRWLQPLPIISGDGFGDPAGLKDGVDPLLMLHKVLFDLKATVGQVVVVLVQEYCDKGTLAAAIWRGIFVPTAHWNVRLARRALLRTAGEVAKGLLHLHDAGVVHGDLKPANVLLSSSRTDRRGFIAKVADFGLSYVLPAAANSMSAEGFGSIAYMAPEMFAGKVSRAVDVWALGVCMWEMLTRRQPFHGMKRHCPPEVELPPGGDALAASKQQLIDALDAAFLLDVDGQPCGAAAAGDPRVGGGAARTAAARIAGNERLSIMATDPLNLRDVLTGDAAAAECLEAAAGGAAGAGPQKAPA